jgi:PAS domain S-box-containing protein
MLAEIPLNGHLELPLAAISVLLAIGAAYVGLELAGRVTASRGWARPIWVAGGATAMGVGIWSTQYVGVLASNFPAAVGYDWPTTLASLVAAILGSTAALLVFSRRQLGVWQAFGGSAIIGCGLAITHYTGAAAIRLAAETARFDPALVALSVLLGVGISFAAVECWFHVRDRSGMLRVYGELACAVVLGLATVLVQYTGGAATHYSASSLMPDLSHSVNGSVLGAIAVTVVTFIVLGLAILTSLYDRGLSDHRAALRSAERRYRYQFQRSPAGMLRVAQDGRILDCNLAAARIFGFETAEELMAAPMTQRYLDIPEPDVLVVRVGSEKPIADLERCLRRKDGSSVWVLSTVSVVDAEDGPPVYDGMMIDITDKKRLEIELLHTRKLEALGHLAAGIAHEINTPVQFVTDNTQFLQEAFASVAEIIASDDRLCAAVAEGLPESDVLANVKGARERGDWNYLQTEVPQALSQMRDGLRRVTTIVAAMREFSQVDRTAQASAADINQGLESTLAVARNEYQYVARIETDFGELPPVICHAGDLNQVFLHLIVNAAHAVAEVVAGTNTLGRISVRTRRNGGWVEVDVSDTGAGIPDHVRDRIFDPFFTTKTVGRGSGQGLTLARAIVVDAHGGTLTFDTQDGKGTTFHVRLPLGGGHRTREVQAA